MMTPKCRIVECSNKLYVLPLSDPQDICLYQEYIMHGVSSGDYMGKAVTISPSCGSISIWIEEG